MPVPDALLDETTRRFALLSDPTRLRLLSLLLERQAASGAELAGAPRPAPPNVSQHLSRLLGGGIVGRSRPGRAVRYAIIDDAIQPLCDLVCSGLRKQAGQRALRLGSEVATV